VRIKAGDEWKAAFITNEGLYEPTVMFFGLTNSPATFQAMMNAIFKEEIEEGWLTVYMDDMLIATPRRFNTPYEVRPQSPGQARETRPLPQTRKMQLRTNDAWNS